MKAKVKEFEIEAQPMTKFEYLDQILKRQLQYHGNTKMNGYYCNWNGYRFWISEDNFNKIYTIIDD